MSLKSKWPLFCLALVCLFQNSCNVDDYDLKGVTSDSLEITTAIDAPLAYTTVTIADMLKHQHVNGLTEDESGILSFYYEDSIHYDRPDFNIDTVQRDKKKYAWNLLKDFLTEDGLKKTDFNKMSSYTLQLHRNDTIPLGSSFSLAFKSKVLDQSRIDSVYLSDEVPVNLRINSNINNLIENCAFVIDYGTGNFFKSASGATSMYISNPKKNQTLSIDQFGGGKIYFRGRKTVDLAGYLLVKNDCEITINKNNYVEFIGSLPKPVNDIKTVWGVFQSDKSKSGTTSMNIDLFDTKKLDMDIKVADPTVNVKVKTNLGVPTVMHVTDISAFDSLGNSKAAVFKNGENYYDVNLDYAKKNGDVVTATDLTFDTENGHIDDIININPKKISASYKLTLPTDVDTSMKGDYFFNNDSYADVNYSVSIPVYLKKGSWISAQDTVNAKMKNYLQNWLDIDFIKVKSTVENGLPFRATCVIYFMEKDSSVKGKKTAYKPIDKLTHTIVCQSAAVNNNHLAETPITTVDTFTYKGSDIDLLKKTLRIVIDCKVSVDDFDKAKVRSTDAVKASVSFYTKFGALIKQIDL